VYRVNIGVAAATALIPKQPARCAERWFYNAEGKMKMKTKIELIQARGKQSAVLSDSKQKLNENN